jgi:hypothetical protein
VDGAGGAVVVVVVDVLPPDSRIFLPRVCWAVLMTMPVELMPRKREKTIGSLENELPSKQCFGSGSGFNQVSGSGSRFGIRIQ